MKTLVVDDEAVTRRMMVATLAGPETELRVAENGQQAWEILQQESIPIVVTDWSMPKMDGLELVRRIRGAGSPSYTYVIMLTGRDEQDDIIRGLHAGVDDYVTKPFDPKELRARYAIGERIIQLEERLRASQEQLQQLATYDPLTGLLNRRGIRHHAEAELARALRSNSAISFALIDIDRFKAVNDQHGHAAGDLALQRVSDALAAHVRPYDWLGRWGGEEFLAVFPGTDGAAAFALGERLRAAVAETPLDLPAPSAGTVSICVGLAEACGDAAEDLDVLLHRADQALYQAKRQGRNRVCLFLDDERSERQSA